MVMVLLIRLARQELAAQVMMSRHPDQVLRSHQRAAEEERDKFRLRRIVC